MTRNILNKQTRGLPLALLIAVTALAALTLIAAILDVVLPFAIAVIALGIAVIIFRHPILGVLGVVAFLPFERIGSVDVSGVTIRAHQVLALLTLFSWGMNQLLRPRRAFRPNPFVVPLLLFLLANTASLSHALNFERSLSVFLFTAFTIAVALLLPQLVVSKKHVEWVVRALIVSSVLVSVFGIFQFLGDIAGLPTTITGLREHYTKAVFGFPRIQSTALEPLYFANYLLLPIGVVISLLVGWKKTHADHPLVRTRVLLPLLILLSVNLILTVSRGGYLALAAMLAVLGVVYLKEVLTPRWVLVTLGSILFAMWAATRFLGLGGGGANLETFRSHVVDVFQGAAYSERIENYEIALRGFREHPILGIGPGSFGPYATVHASIEPKEGWKIVNNEFLELLAETGVVGFSLFLFFAGFLIVRSIKASSRARGSPLERSILIGLTATWIGILVQYQTFSILYIMHVWVVVGLLVAVQNNILSPHNVQS